MGATFVAWELPVNATILVQLRCLKLAVAQFASVYAVHGTVLGVLKLCDIGWTTRCGWGSGQIWGRPL